MRHQIIEDTCPIFLRHLNRALRFAFPLVVNLSPKSRLGTTLVHKYHGFNFKSVKSI